MSGRDVSKAIDDARAFWVQQLTAAIKTIETWCPQWQVAQQSDTFPSKDLVKALVLNPNYNKLTGAANALQDVVKVNNSLVQLGVSPPFSPAELKNAVTARELAYNTTSLTYCVFKLYVDIPKLKAQSKQKTDAVALREALKLKLFTIPPSREEVDGF